MARGSDGRKDDDVVGAAITQLDTHGDVLWVMRDERGDLW
jgi:hypothetical protein